MGSQLLILIDSEASKAEASTYLVEAIDAAMGVAAFGVTTSILFMGDCVKSAVGDDRIKIINALEFYDVENLYIFESDLDRVFDTLPLLGSQFKVLKDNEFSNLLEQHAQVLRMG